MWTVIKRREYAIERKGESMGRTAKKVDEGTGASEDFDPVVLVDVEQMHPTDVMTLRRRVTAANTRITAEVEELRASQYGNFQPEETLARYDALERAIDAGKKLLMRVACVVIALGVMAGCCDHAQATGGDVPVTHHCANGTCSAK